MARDYSEYKEYYRLKRAEKTRLKAESVKAEYTAKGWKPIPGFDDYLVSENGQIVNKYGRLLKPGRNGLNGYLHVLLANKETGPKHMYVHQAVWAAFVGTRTEGTKVCHVDSDPSNNSLSNLAELTDKENLSKATTRMKMREKRLKTKEVFQKKATYKYDAHKHLIKVYDSVAQTSEDGHSVHFVSKCCNGKQKTHQGFIFTHEPITDAIIEATKKRKVKNDTRTSKSVDSRGDEGRRKVVRRSKANQVRARQRKIQGEG